VWNKDKTKYNDARVKKISDTFKRKNLDNFALWRLNARKTGKIPDVTKPFEQSKELAFLIGLVLGDGYVTNMAHTDVLKITLGTDKPRLWQYAEKIVTEIFNKKPHVYKRKNALCMDIRIYQKNICERLKIPPGAKKNYILQLPLWIWENEEFLTLCIKGLFESEGSLSIHLKTCTYNFSFSNVNVGLLNEVEKALLKFGFHPERRLNAVRLRKKNEVFAFKQLINFRQYP